MAPTTQAQKPTEYDLLVQINQKLDALSAASGGTGNVNLAPVLAALTGIQNTVNLILAENLPTPNAQQPVVSGVSPASGPAGTPTLVTVSGSNFTGATGVMFGTVAGTNLQVQNDGSLTITSPNQPAGQVDITVIDAAGTSVVVPADQFTYQ